MEDWRLKKAFEVDDWDNFLVPRRLEASGNDVWSWRRDGRLTLQKITGFYSQDQERLERFLKWIEKCKRK